MNESNQYLYQLMCQRFDDAKPSRQQRMLNDANERVVVMRERMEAERQALNEYRQQMDWQVAVRDYMEEKLRDVIADENFEEATA